VRLLGIDGDKGGLEVIGLDDTSDLLGGVADDATSAQDFLRGRGFREEREGNAECNAERRRLRCTTSFAALLFSDKAKEPGVPQAFFCLTVKKNPVVGARRWIVGIVFHQVASKASIDCEAPTGSCSGGAVDSVTSVT